MKCILKVVNIVEQMLQNVIKLRMKPFYPNAITEMFSYIVHKNAYFFILCSYKNTKYSILLDKP